jgi:hypothetical protein
VAKHRLSVDVTDDGSTVAIVVHRWDTVGGVEIGPTHVADRQSLAFPIDDIDQWHRDMIVMVLELL